tara:strand:- start:117 stop:455 length:339 start_codon:yes stop_codon:yes gene_type:complete
MRKRKIMNYHQNNVDQVIAAQILADRAGLDNLHKAKLVNSVKDSENNNSKKVKFKRLANKRVNKSLISLKLVSNLANKKNYSFSEREVKQIMNKLNVEIQNLKKKFKKNIKN